MLRGAGASSHVGGASLRRADGRFAGSKATSLLGPRASRPQRAQRASSRQHNHEDPSVLTAHSAGETPVPGKKAAFNLTLTHRSPGFPWNKPPLTVYNPLAFAILAKAPEQSPQAISP
jgi:hypothetical protein